MSTLPVLAASLFLIRAFRSSSAEAGGRSASVRFEFLVLWHIVSKPKHEVDTFALSAPIFAIKPVQMNRPEFAGDHQLK
jgi:hypothetical protein